jgi:hypothetical protein
MLQLPPDISNFFLARPVSLCVMNANAATSSLRLPIPLYPISHFPVSFSAYAKMQQENDVMFF